jgi:hypothetical protein
MEIGTEVPNILNLGNGSKLVIRFMSLLLHPRGKNAPNPENRRLGKPRSLSGL